MYRFLLSSIWLPRAVVQALADAARTWAIAPHVYRVERYATTESGRTGVRYRRTFRLREVLRLKLASAIRVFAGSVRLGLARDLVVTRFPEEGLLANFLHVLEVIHRVRPDARVHVNWAITGTEIAFRYGDKGEDIWTRLFQTLGPPSTGIAHEASCRAESAFWGTGKDHLTGTQLQKHREVYHSTILKRIEIANRRILEQVDDVCGRQFHGRFCVGIHRRVGNAMVANLQRDGKIPSLESIIQTVQSIISVSVKSGIPDYAVFLATDDAEAVGALKEAFGPNLIVRENVQRTTAHGIEVHFGKWDQLSITDAEDVLIDTVLLSQCNVLVHASSSVSTVASLMNPALILVRA